MLSAGLFLLVAIFCSSVHGICEPEVIKRIEDYWKLSKAPRLSIKQLRGTATKVHESKFIQDARDPKVKCVQTVIHSDSMSGTVISTHTDKTTVNITGYNFIVERPGVITVTDPTRGQDVTDFWRYVLFYDKQIRVLAYYECKPFDANHKPLVAVEVINRNLSKRNKHTMTSIRVAMSTLKVLAIEDSGKALSTKHCLKFRWQLTATTTGLKQ